MTQKEQTVMEGLPAAAIPSVIQEGFAAVQFVKPHLDRDKNDLAEISFELSLPLTDEHRDWMPIMVAERWEALVALELKSLVIGQPIVCNVELAIVPNGDDRSLVLKSVVIERMQLSTLIEKGTGEEREITRLQIRVTTSISDDNWRFARNHFGHPIWLKWEESQGKLGL